MKRIGIMGGTFDPVHNGHLLLGKQAYFEYHLDEVWFMPSHVPPHKKDHQIASGEDRIHMLHLALSDIPYCSVSDFEMQREGNTYTAQTMALLKKAYPDVEFYFIIGADSLYQLEQWYHPEDVMRLTSFLVAGRPYESHGVTIEEKIACLHKKYGARIQILHNKEMDIASADIRKKASIGESIEMDVPERVAEYIQSRHLYENQPDVAESRH